ncbi:MAG: OsmC family protein [Thermoanaerobaculia bacterium]|nr:OsmC family protein [Thermoanaerobaculia bacterium]
MNPETMTVSFPGGVAVDAEWKGHTIRTDQPEGQGGADDAPSPFDLFLASIATCVGFYVVQFCRARDLDTEGLRIEMKPSRDRDRKLITKLDLEITLPDSFPERYRTAVQRAADQCTVKRHLADPPEIRLSLN